MSIDSKYAENLWDEFLQRWPLEQLDNLLTLEAYTQVKGDNEHGDSFTYWLEKKTEDMGSIWGGSSFKFGIYHRGNSLSKEDGRGRVYGDKYAWYSKYDKDALGTPEGAFRYVKDEVLRVAKAANAGDLDLIQQADLGPAVKWKIAFIYQDRNNPIVIPIFNLELLRASAGMPKLSYHEIYKKLTEARAGSPLFPYAESLWIKGKKILDSQLTQEAALDFLQERFLPVVDKNHPKYMAGFATEDGRQIGLVRRGKEVTLFVEPGAWQSRETGVTLIKKYEVNEPRIHSLEANAPRLYVGNVAHKILIPSLSVLSDFCDAYEEGSGNPDLVCVSKINEKFSFQDSRCNSMNKILYGPPGTGKTHKTAQLAVEICDGAAPTDREDLMARYEELRGDGRISFVTFHQSYGYEDFVEGLRPEMNEGQVTYRIRPGVFREVCDTARRNTLVKPGLSGKPLRERTIFKMSLGAAGTSEGRKVFQACIENGIVLLGWGDNIDFSECRNADEVLKKATDSNAFENPKVAAGYIDTFKHNVRVGDIIVASHGNRAFQAIGEVLDEYEFLEAPLAEHFHQKRAVRWLAVYEAKRPVEEIYDRNFSQSSLYTLDHTGVRFDVLESLLTEQQSAINLPFVLIIDEINRANISKVFGELITLLEEGKREGATNALTVKLPYSGDEFCVPANLYVIGTMNTADRSIALLDTALRRRFEFEELQPDISALPEEAVEGVDLRRLLHVINERIEYLYDRDHTIGHAYFIGIESLAELEGVFRRKVIPLLQEYFYENWSKVRAVLNDVDGAFIEVQNNVPRGLETVVDGFDPRPRYRVNRTAFTQTAFKRIYE